jgi:hypothetical protein
LSLSISILSSHILSSTSNKNIFRSLVQLAVLREILTYSDNGSHLPLSAYESGCKAAITYSSDVKPTSIQCCNVFRQPLIYKLITVWRHRKVPPPPKKAGRFGWRLKLQFAKPSQLAISFLASFLPSFLPVCVKKIEGDFFNRPETVNACSERDVPFVARKGLTEHAQIN